MENDSARLKKEVEAGFSEYGRKLSFEFINPDHTLIECSPDRQSITKIGAQAKWVRIYGNNPIYKMGKTYFEVQITQKTPETEIMIGYSLKNADTQNGFLSRFQKHLLSCRTGYYTTDFKIILLQSMFGIKGDVIRSVFS